MVVRHIPVSQRIDRRAMMIGAATVIVALASLPLPLLASPVGIDVGGVGSAGLGYSSPRFIWSDGAVASRYADTRYLRAVLLPPNDLLRTPSTIRIAFNGTWLPGGGPNSQPLLINGRVANEPMPARLQSDPLLLPREVQAELYRLECLQQKPDGKWGPGSAAALAMYVSSRGVESAKQPTGVLLAKLTTENGPVCSPPPVAEPVEPAPKKPAVKKVKKPNVANGGGGGDNAPAVTKPDPPAAVEPVKKKQLNVTIIGG